MNEQARVKLDPAAVEAVLKTYTTPGECLIALYKMVFPNWDAIDKVDGFPRCNKTTWSRICNWFQVLDAEINKVRRMAGKIDIMVGGAWMNNGFGTLGIPDDLADWEVLPCEVVLREKCIS